MTDEKPRVRFDMKYIGWNLGATRIERHDSKANIEILNMTIDDVDILQQLEKLEAVKTWCKACAFTRTMEKRDWLELWKILEPEA